MDLSIIKQLFKNLFNIKYSIFKVKYENHLIIKKKFKIA